MVQVNWTIVTYFVVGLFALSGFFKGWWKEAVTSFFLGVLVFLLLQSSVATTFISTINTLLTTVWNILPSSITSVLQTLFADVFGVSTASTGGALVFDPSNPTTWLVILIIFMIVAILIGRLGLRRDLTGAGRFYAPTFTGSILGGLLGGLNGFIIINLIKGYLQGTNLPGTTGVTGMVATTAASNSIGVANVGIQATNLPQYSILDSFIPWIVIVIGMLLFAAAIGTRYSRQGMNISAKKVPYGYKGFEVIIKPPAK